MVSHWLVVVNVLSGEGKAYTGVRHLRTRSIAQPTSKPDIFRVAVGYPDLFTKDLDN